MPKTKKLSLKAISLTGLKINTKEHRVKFSKLNKMVSTTHAKFHKLLPFLNSYYWCKFQFHRQRCLRYNTERKTAARVNMNVEIREYIPYPTLPVFK